MIEKILISLIFVWLRVKKWNDRKSGMIEKMSLYKFTHISLLKNDTKFKQKSDKQQPKKKNNHPNIL